MKREIILGATALVGVAGSLMYQAGSFVPAFLVGDLQAAGTVIVPTTKPAPTNTAAPTPGAPVTQTVDGDIVNTRYGLVQIQLVVVDGVITKVNPLQMPSGENGKYTTTALPILIEETLQAQSAQIASVSGASYTSQGYTISLQGAISRIQ
jgi:uncharacterized protein with FMN-binding domain